MSTDRARIAALGSDQVRCPHAVSPQRHTRLSHTNTTGRPPAGKSRTHRGLRSCSVATEMVRDKFALTDLVMVGDRGMITSARIEALRQHTDLGWLTALRAPAVAALAAEDGPLQLTLFDEFDLAEITHPDYPGERLIACRNPLLAADRARTRAELLAATEAVLAPLAAAVAAGRLAGADQIGLKVGKVVNTFKMAKHF